MWFVSNKKKADESHELRNYDMIGKKIEKDTSDSEEEEKPKPSPTELPIDATK